ncbi:hypothetical protein PAPYR_12134 [Paratrimastix pyriformis]|uniref:Uncharacterized protein n=1 Tax=Paratrimastix pyriformis TaxID=342808 RepID=A0ABQ8U6D2_9EUKA|nr:hypothetical protein PAPYR_12134 [Paratrimastix pyriformis]
MTITGTDHRNYHGHLDHGCDNIMKPQLTTPSPLSSMVLETLFPANFRIRAAGVCYSLSLVRFAMCWCPRKARCRSPLAPRICPDEAKDLADAGAEFNDAAMNDGEPSRRIAREGGDELPAPEEQDVVSADDLDLFAPKVLAKVPDLLTEAVKPDARRFNTNRSPLRDHFPCRMYPSLPYDLKLPLRQPETSAPDSAPALGAPEVERILVGFEVERCSSVECWFRPSLKWWHRKQMRRSVMLASAPKGIDDTTDMFSREDLAA